MTTRLFCALIPILAFGSANATGPDFATTPDGRTLAMIDPIDAPAAPRGTDAPYADAPDWENTLRIQVAGLAFGDLDGDGSDDLAVGTYHSNSFPPYEDWHDYVYFNTGEALEDTPSWQSSDQQHTGEVGIADINGDGFNDLVSVRGGSSYDPSVVYYGASGGLATTPGWQSAVSAWGVGMALADIDADGDTDLVSTNQGNSTQDPYRPMYLFRNDGSALGTTPEWESAEASIQNSVAVGDLDGDGDADLATAKWVDFESAAYENIGGTPDTVPYWTTGTVEGDRGVAIADFDGDGDNDILLGQEVLRVFDNDGAGGFVAGWQSDNPDSDHQGLAVADVNADGWPDIADIDFARGKVWIHLNHEGALETTPSWSYDGDGAGTAVAFGDVNGDTLPDLAIGFSGEPSVAVFLNQGEVPDTDTIFANGFETP